MAFEDIKVRSYDGGLDRARLELLERRCEVGPSQHFFLFTDTMGDPLSRIRNSPLYIMLVNLYIQSLSYIYFTMLKLVTCLFTF